MTNERKNELLDCALSYTSLLREESKSMTFEECIFFLQTLRAGIKAAEDVFVVGQQTLGSQSVVTAPIPDGEK